MYRYLFRRLATVLLVLLGMSIIVFTISHLIPGDPARMLAGRLATPDQLADVRARLGLDQPLHIQYLTYMKGLVSGDLGRSIVSRRPVRDELVTALPSTAELVLTAMIINVCIAIPLGVLSAVRRGSVLDAFSRVVAVVGVGLPVFWLGMMAQLVLYGWLGAVPLGGRLSVWTVAPPGITGMYIIDSILSLRMDALLDAVRHIMVPALVLAFGQIAVVTRMTRSSMLEVLGSDYIRTAWAKGLPARVVVYRHALKNAIFPTLTIIGMQFGWMFGGTILIETIFSWGGMGFYAVTGIRQNDFPVIMSTTLVISFVFVFANLVVDLLYAYLDPRIRYN